MSNKLTIDFNTFYQREIQNLIDVGDPTNPHFGTVILTAKEQCKIVWDFFKNKISDQNNQSIDNSYSYSYSALMLSSLEDNIDNLEAELRSVRQQLDELKSSINKV